MSGSSIVPFAPATIHKHAFRYSRAACYFAPKCCSITPPEIQDINVNLLRVAARYGDVATYYAAGRSPVPTTIAALLRLLRQGRITIDDIED
jgi:hypothetical protein